MESVAQDQVASGEAGHAWLRRRGSTDELAPVHGRDMVLGNYVVHYSVHAEALAVLRVWHPDESPA